MTPRIPIIVTMLSAAACSKPDDAVLCAAEALKSAEHVSVGSFGKSMNRGYADVFLSKVKGSHREAASEATRLADESHPYEPLIANATCEAMLTEKDRQAIANYMVEDGLSGR